MTVDRGFVLLLLSTPTWLWWPAAARRPAAMEEAETKMAGRKFGEENVAIMAGKVW